MRARPSRHANSGFDNSCRLDIICIRMNFADSDAGRVPSGRPFSGRPFFWKVKRDPLRETHHGRRGARFAWRGRLAHPCRRHRFLSGARQQAVPRQCPRHQRPGGAARHCRDREPLGHRRAHDLDRSCPPSLAGGFRCAEAGGARSRLGADPERRLRSPAISATPRRPPTACRPCWCSTPRSNCARRRRRVICRCRISFSATAARPCSPAKWSPPSASRNTRPPARRLSSSSARGAISSFPSPWWRRAWLSRTASSAKRPSPSAPVRRSPSGSPASKPPCAACRPTAALADAVLSAPMAELSPIGDVRGSAEYRLDAAREIVARAVLGPADRRTTRMVAA